MKEVRTDVVGWLRTVELFAAVPENYLEVEFDCIICCLCGSNNIVLMEGLKNMFL